MIKITRDRDFYRTMLAVALPAAFQALIAQLVNLADTMMVGRLPGAAIAGVAHTGSLSNIYIMTISGLVSGASVLIAQYWGKRDIARIKQIFSIALTICGGLSVVVAVLAITFKDFILMSTASDIAVVEAALKYITFFVLSFIPYALAQALIGMLRAIEVARFAMYVSLISLFVNIGLNAVLINGLFGFPAMGVRGAGLATLLARTVELAVVLFYTFKVQKAIKLNVKDMFKTEGWLWRDYAKFGLPVALGDAQWALVGLGKTWIIGRFDSHVLSANAIAEQMLTLGMLFCFALANGAAIVIGKTVGRGDYIKTREYSTSIQLLFLLFGIFFAGLVFLTRGAFVSLYGTSAEIATLAIAMIALGAPTMIGTCYHASCFVGINRGAGDSKFVMYVDIICGWLVVLPMSALAAFVWKVPVQFMFLFLRIDQCFKWIIAFIRLRGNKWIKNATRG